MTESCVFDSNLNYYSRKTRSTVNYLFDSLYLTIGKQLPQFCISIPKNERIIRQEDQNNSIDFQKYELIVNRADNQNSQRQLIPNGYNEREIQPNSQNELDRSHDQIEPQDALGQPSNHKLSEKLNGLVNEHVQPTQKINPLPEGQLVLGELSSDHGEPQKQEISPHKEEQYVEIVYQRNDTQEDQFNNRNDHKATIPESEKDLEDDIAFEGEKQNEIKFENYLRQHQPEFEAPYAPKQSPPPPPPVQEPIPNPQDDPKPAEPPKKIPFRLAKKQMKSKNQRKVQEQPKPQVQSQQEVLRDIPKSNFGKKFIKGSPIRKLQNEQSKNKGWQSPRSHLSSEQKHSLLSNFFNSNAQ